SLLLCLALIGLWVRSSWVADDVAWAWPTRGNPNYAVWVVGVGTNQNGLDFSFQKRKRSTLPFGLSWASNADPAGQARPTWRWLGFQGLVWNPPPMTHPDLASVYVVEVPYEFLIVLACVLPLLWLWRFAVYLARKPRRDEGLCPSCGYDLRASKERCPECGRPIETRLDNYPG
ncbi:MAG: hypothetical protein ACM359_06860, partial [Bacillota bacterium]